MFLPNVNDAPVSLEPKTSTPTLAPSSPAAPRFFASIHSSDSRGVEVSMSNAIEGLSKRCPMAKPFASS
jgi:hypothetical protein